MIRALFLDVGNTLMFCEVDPILRLLEEENIPATASAVVEAERGGRRKLDSVVIPVLRNGGTPGNPNRLFWECYFSVLMNELRVPADRRREITEKIDRHMNNPATWSHIEPDTFEVLEGLRREGYLLGVISNSNGTIERHLASHNLRDYFRFVVDSGVIGKNRRGRSSRQAARGQESVRKRRPTSVISIRWTCWEPSAPVSPASSSPTGGPTPTRPAAASPVSLSFPGPWLTSTADFG